MVRTGSGPRGTIGAFLTRRVGALGPRGVGLLAMAGAGAIAGVLTVHFLGRPTSHAKL
jgi:hypothetical protein